MVKGGELILTLSFSRKHFKNKTIEQVTERYQSNLKALIAHCMEQRKSGNVYTPSDYGLESDISYEELDKFLHVDDKDNIMSF